MASGVEIANAYVSLLVKMDSPKKRIEDALDVDGEEAGGKIGTGLGKGISAKTAAIAGAVGGIVSSIANQAVGALTDLVGEAIAASDATDKFAQTLSFAGLDTSSIDSAMSTARAYADATVYDLSTIQNTTAQLAANGIKDYSALTEAAGNLNAVAGGNTDTFASVAMALTQTAGQGKLTTENWNQLADAIPGASGRLQEALLAAGAYTGDFRDAMSKGMITSEEFNAALLQLGSEPVAQEAAKSVTTMEGAIGNLQASIVGGLSDAFTAIKPVLTEIINGLAGFVTFIQDNISWIGPLALGVAGVATAVGLWSAAQWILNAALTANPIGLIIVAVGLLVGAIILLVQNWDAVVKWLTEIWGGFIGWIKGVIDGFVTWWNATWTAVGSFIANLWETWIVGPIRRAIDWINQTITNVINNIRSVWENGWSAIGSFVRGIWNNIVGWIESGVNGAIDLINGFTGGIRDVAGAVFGVEIGPIPHVSIPRLADGGVVTASRGGTLAVIGEGGRDEAVVPLPADWRQNGIGGGTQVQVDVHPGPGLDEATIGTIAAREIAWQLRSA